MLLTVQRAILVIVAWGFALSGCATRQYRANEVALPDDSLQTVYQTQVATGSCIFGNAQESFAAIGAALLSGVVAEGVNTLGAMLSASAEAIDDSAPAMRNVELTKRTVGPCVQVMRGLFYRGFDSLDEHNATEARAAASWARPQENGVLDPGRLKGFWGRRMWPAAQPDFIFEAQIVPSSADNIAVVEQTGGRYLTMVPLFARLDHPISRAPLRRSLSRDVAVFIAFGEAKSAPLSPSSAASGMVLGRLKPGQEVRFPTPGIGNPNTPNRAAFESPWFQLAVGENKKPMTLSALVTEHQDANLFFKFVASVFAGAKAPVTTAIQNAVVPTLREAAQESEQSQRETVQGTYESALAQAWATAGTCAAGVTDPLGSANELRGKIRALNRAARAADSKLEIDENLVKLVLDAGTVSAGCGDVRKAIADALKT